MVDGVVYLVKIASKGNLVDPFTKTLMDMSFEKHVEGIRIGI